MILVIIGVGVVLFIAGILLDNVTYADCAPLIGASMCIAISAFVIAVFLGINVKDLSVIDDRIAMYEEENTKIETQISEVVKEYMEFESDVIMDVAPNSAITLVSLYPELKSDALVSSQIEIYISNNRTIKELKDKQIRGSVSKWWLYFGS